MSLLLLLTGSGEAPPVETTTSRIAVTQEFPPDKLAWRIDPPNGAPSRWAADEPLAENVCEDIQLNDEMPGGDKEGTTVLARDPRIPWPDIAPYSDVSVYGPGVEEVANYRLDKAPETDGDRKAITPAAVGWRAALEDDNAMIGPGFIGGDLGQWSDPSTQRRLDIINAVWMLAASASVGTRGAGAATASLFFDFTSVTKEAGKTAGAELWYDGGGVDIGALLYDFIGDGTTTWVTSAGVSNDDVLTSSEFNSPNGATALQQSKYSASAGMKHAFLVDFYSGAFVGAMTNKHYFENVKVLGHHGLALQGTWPDVGFTVSQMLAYAIPLYTELIADPEDLEDSGYVIGNAWFSDPGPMTQVVQELTKYDLLDWFVFGGKRFQMKFPGTYGRRWQAYVGPSGLEEQGLDGSRLWREIVVSYQDVDGTTRTVGPPGSGATVEEPGLEITDPDHPAVRAGITRKDLLSLNGISTAARATEAGERWLAEANLLPRSGNCTLSGYVMDDRGIYRPVSQVRAGDTIRFPDSGDTSYRKVVTRSYSHTARSASLALDAPANGIAALLERLQADIKSLQLG